MSKYNIDLDYVIPDIDISWEELREIEAEADKIISENKESKENLAVAYLKKAQIKRKGGGCHASGFVFYDETECSLFKPKGKKEINRFLVKALELIPDMPEALMQFGLLNKIGWRNNNDKAKNFISRAIQLKPDYAAAFNNRAMLFYNSVDIMLIKMLSVDNQGYNKNLEIVKPNYRNAIADLTEAIKIRPFDALYHLNRGTFYSKLGEHQKAAEDFSSAIHYASDVLKERLKTEVLIFNLRGKEYTELKDYDKAIDDFTESLRLKPDHDETLLFRGKVYYLAGEKDKAKADIEEYLNRKRNVVDTACRNEIIKIFGVTPEDIL